MTPGVAAAPRLSDRHQIELLVVELVAKVGRHPQISVFEQLLRLEPGPATVDRPAWMKPPSTIITLPWPWSVPVPFSAAVRLNSDMVTSSGLFPRFDGEAGGGRP